MSNIKFDDLIVQLRSPDPDARVAAADGLGQYAAYHEDISMLPSAVPHLAEALRADPVRGVRLAAAYSLGAIGDVHAVPELIDVLRASDSDRGMQLVIVKALGKIGDPLAVPALIEALQSSKSRCVSAAAAKALECIGTPEALAALEELRKKHNVR
jgi:HEAT repeat protein